MNSPTTPALELTFGPAALRRQQLQGLDPTVFLVAVANMVGGVHRGHGS